MTKDEYTAELKQIKALDILDPKRHQRMKELRARHEKEHGMPDLGRVAITTSFGIAYANHHASHVEWLAAVIESVCAGWQMSARLQTAVVAKVRDELAVMSIVDGLEACIDTYRERLPGVPSEQS